MVDSALSNNKTYKELESELKELLKLRSEIYSGLKSVYHQEKSLR